MFNISRDMLHYWGQLPDKQLPWMKFKSFTTEMDGMCIVISLLCTLVTVLHRYGAL